MARASNRYNIPTEDGDFSGVPYTIGFDTDGVYIYAGDTHIQLAEIVETEAGRLQITVFGSHGHMRCHTDESGALDYDYLED